MRATQRTRKKKTAATTTPAKGGGMALLARHPLTEITAAVRTLWDCDKRMANPTSRAEARQASNAFDVVLAGLIREVARLSVLRGEGEYTTVQG